jgi:alanine racemase
MEVSLESYRHNYRNIRDHVKRRVIAVVKSNSYGMGAVPVAWTLKSEGVDFFGVATPDEALELREAGIRDPILVLGASPYDAARMYVKEGVRVAMTDEAMAAELSKEAVRQGRAAYVHLKVDSGMGRIGFLPHAVGEIASLLRRLPGIEVEGVFTHFAMADEADLSYTHHQFDVFVKSVEAVKKAGLNPAMIHCCNSGALMSDLSYMFCDAVRPGHILCGLIPSSDSGHAISIEPCFEVKTAISVVRELPEGSSVSYGQTHWTDGPTVTAVLPVGYADGYSRALSNRGEVLIHGKRCPVIGRVCMDQCVADVTKLDNPRPGDEVVLIGRQGDEAVTIEDVVDWIGCNSGMVPLMFSARVPRVYP